MAKVSQFFRVFVEGDTVDGRTIARKDIQDIADTYNPKTYGARVNLEHMRGLLADGPFASLGDVTAVKAQLDDIEIAGKTEKRLALYAQIAPLQALIDINQKGQKIYTSVEIQPNFANTGKAGLVGLAITDSPASLGTEALQFAASAKVNPFANRKKNPENLFSAAREVTFEFVETNDGEDKSGAAGALAAIKDFFTKNTPQTQQIQTQAVVTEDKSGDKAADANAALFAKGLEVIAQSFDAGIAKITAAQTAQADEIKALKADLEKAPKTYKSRSQATGAETAAQTDC
jgi:Phage capsid scaffolding protein (GPO) serine peptidase